MLYLLILGCAGKAAYLSPRAQPPSLCRSPPSPLAAPRFPLNLLPGVVGGDRAVLLQPRRFRSHGRSPAAEGGASPPTAFSVGTWGGGGGCRLDLWPCWYPSCSREYSWESSRACACTLAGGGPGECHLRTRMPLSALPVCHGGRFGRLCLGGARVHLPALGYVNMCVGCDPPYSPGRDRDRQEVETRGCLHPTAEILILPCGLQIPVLIYKLSYPICPVELIPGRTRL